MEFTAIIPTYHRCATLATTLQRLHACTPPPDAILVHVTAGDDETFQMLEKEHPHIRVVTSDDRAGPGGARNVLLKACGTQWAASFDDDSYPLDAEFFRLAAESVAEHPDAGVISCAIYEKDDEPGAPEPPGMAFQRCIDFANGACLWRRDAFFSTRGHIPLVESWCMEEQDVGLQLFAQGHTVVFAPHLRVFHNSARGHHHQPRIAAASLANIGLLVFLRYPVWLWPLGALQVGRYILWMLRNGRGTSVWKGLAMLPSRCAIYKKERTPLPASTVWRYLTQKRLLQRRIRNHRTIVAEPAST